MKAALLTHENDNVATLLEDVSKEHVHLIGTTGRPPVMAVSRIERGHKIACQTIPAASPVIKYGVAIGIAKREIQPGEWVHLHNCRSQVDERSGGFETGAEEGVESKYA
jgi:hypothetical protein